MGMMECIAFRYKQMQAEKAASDNRKSEATTNNTDPGIKKMCDIDH